VAQAGVALADVVLGLTWHSSRLVRGTHARIEAARGCVNQGAETFYQPMGARPSSDRDDLGGSE
jgi:hypothetical protein